MSIQAMNYVRSLKVGRSSDKFVLMCIANYADEDGLAYPSQKRLGDDTEMDRKTIISSLASLISAGHLRDTGERRGATKQVIVYQIICQKGGCAPNGTENGTVPFFPPKSPVFPAKESQKRDTEPSLNLQLEPSDSAPSGAATSKPGVSKKGTRWAPDREVPPEWLASAAARRAKAGLPAIDLRAEAENFVTYWPSVAGARGVKLNWKLTFENSCLRARGPQVPYQSNGSGFGVPSSFQGTNEAGWRNRLRVFDGLAGEPAGSWAVKWGPPPTDPGCRVPPEILEQRSKRTAK